MKEPHFKPGQFVRVLTAPGVKEGSVKYTPWYHFVNQFAVVEVIKFQQLGEYRGYHIYGTRDCFNPKSENNGKAGFGYTQGVQFIIEDELEFVARKTVNMIRNPAQLPQI